MAKRVWNAEAADAAAETFVTQLKTAVDSGEMDAATLVALAVLWKATYMTSGHKRLGRKLLAWAN